MKVGDLVTRKSHGHDIIFRVIGVHSNGYVRLKGHHWRLEADAPIHDLTQASLQGSAETWAHTRDRMATAKKKLYQTLDRCSLSRNTINHI